MEIAQIIKNNTDKDDTIYTHNLNGAIYVKADRLSATRYFALPAVNIDNFPELQNEFLSDIEGNKPRMIVIDSRYLRLTRDTDRKLMSIIDKDYSVFTEQESVTLYKLKEM